MSNRAPAVRGLCRRSSCSRTHPYAALLLLSAGVESVSASGEQVSSEWWLWCSALDTALITHYATAANPSGAL